MTHNIPCPNPYCDRLDCPDHCNNCGEEIIWNHSRYRGDGSLRHPFTKKKQPLNKPDGTLHHGCMLEHNPKYFKDGKIRYDRDTDQKAGYFYTLDDYKNAE